MVDLVNRTIDVAGTVVLRVGVWVVLLACSPHWRVKVCFFTFPARPSHIHVALLMLGLEPGAPMRSWLEGDEAKFTPPRGPKVAISIVYEKDGKQVEVPAGDWVVNQKTHEPLRDSTWIFAGSTMGEVEGQKVYYADMNGTVISLVNFGDDLLSRDTAMTNNNDDATWGANTEAIPPVGTKVTLRLRPVEAASTQPAQTRPAGR
jgi:hypothetical protein